MEVKLFNSSIGSLEYSKYGTGKLPLMILHGGHGNARETLSHKYLDSSEHFTLITPSRPGYGKTHLVVVDDDDDSDNNNTSSSSTYSNQTPVGAARQLVELIDYLGYQKVNLIGISAGGPTAIALATMYPDRINKLVLESAVTHRWLQPGDTLYRKSKCLFHPRIEGNTWTIVRFFLRLFPHFIIRCMAAELTSVRPLCSFSPEEVDDMKSMLQNQSSQNGFVTDLEHELEPGLIGQVIAPTFIVHSRNDGAVGVTHPEYANKNICNSELLWVDNTWGHLIWMGNESVSIIGAVIDFLLKE